AGAGYETGRQRGTGFGPRLVDRESRSRASDGSGGVCRSGDGTVDDEWRIGRGSGPRPVDESLCGLLIDGGVRWVASGPRPLAPDPRLAPAPSRSRLCWRSLSFPFTPPRAPVMAEPYAYRSAKPKRPIRLPF